MKTKHQRTLWLRFDRALANSLLRQFAFLGIVLVIGLGLSYLFLSWSNAEWEQFCEAKELNKWLLPLYLLIDSNALNTLYIGDINDGAAPVHGWMLLASSLTFLFGAFVFNGVIIGMITNCIERRVQNHQEGHIHYLKSGHHVIMGYDDMVPSFISYVFDNDDKAYALILTSEDAADIRERLMRSFPRKQMERIIINYGHRISEEAYRDIHLEMADQVYVVGDRHQTAHDAVNIECMDCICRYLGKQTADKRPNRITCVFNDLDTYAAFKTSEIFSKLRQLDVEFVPYNFYTGWANQLFVQRQYRDFNNPDIVYRYPAVYGQGITPDDDKYVHLVFVGTSEFAVALAMEAAHVLHFPNAGKARTRLTFIDLHADTEKDEFIARNRHFFEIQAYRYEDLTASPDREQEGVRTEHLRFTGEDANFLDVEFEFIKGDMFSKAVQDKIGEWAADHNSHQYLSIFLAMTDQRQNFAMGMNMPDAVYDYAVPLFIRQDRSDNFVTDLRHADRKADGEQLTYAWVDDDGQLQSQPRHARFANIYPFGMSETAYSADEQSLKRAKLINYLYDTADYATCQFQSIETLNAIPEDRIQQSAEACWKKLSVALQWSSLYNAYTLQTKLATLRAMRGLTIDDQSLDSQPLSTEELEQLTIVEHNRWNVEKLLMGYRKALQAEDKYVQQDFAAQLKKNKSLFIHHDIRPFSQLDVIKALDSEFSRYIPWIISG